MEDYVMSAEKKDDLRLNKNAYILESMFEYFISILTSGAYLAKLTTTIGISDGMTAILSAVASLTAMFQVFSIFLAHKTPVKRWVLPMTFIPQALISTLYLIPFLKVGALAPILFFIIILISNASHNIVAPPKSDWFFSPIEPSKRGNFQATMSMVSIIGGTLFTYIAGNAIDRYEANGNLNSLFIILTIVIFILSVLQMLCLLVAKSDTREIEKKENPLKSVKNILKNKAFVRFLILNSIWAVANSITTPFLSTYQIKELGFSMSFISAVTIVLNVLNVVVLFVTGKYSEKHSYSSLFFVSFVFALLGFTAIIFTTPSNGQVMFTIYRVFNLLFGAALGISMTPLIFSMVDENERTSALAFKSIISGLFGFVVTLVATPIFTALQSANIVIFGIKLFAQQILAFFSFILTVILLVYYLFCYKSISNK